MGLVFLRVVVLVGHALGVTRHHPQLPVRLAKRDVNPLRVRPSGDFPLLRADGLERHAAKVPARAEVIMVTRDRVEGGGEEAELGALAPVMEGAVFVDDISGSHIWANTNGETIAWGFA